MIINIICVCGFLCCLIQLWFRCTHAHSPKVRDRMRWVCGVRARCGSTSDATHFLVRDANLIGAAPNHFDHAHKTRAEQTTHNHICDTTRELWGLRLKRPHKIQRQKPNITFKCHARVASSFPLHLNLYQQIWPRCKCRMNQRSE